MKAIKDSINAFIENYIKQGNFYAARAEVLEVNAERNTATVVLSNTGATLLNVNFLAFVGAKYGVIATPKIGAIVNVGFNSETDAHIINCSDIENLKIIFEEGTSIEITSDLININAGELGGLVKINELTQKLNGLVNEINAMWSELKTHTHTSAAAGSPTTTPVPPLTSPSAAEFSAADYENEKIKQ